MLPTMFGASMVRLNDIPANPVLPGKGAGQLVGSFPLWGFYACARSPAADRIRERSLSRLVGAVAAWVKDRWEIDVPHRSLALGRGLS